MTGCDEGQKKCLDVCLDLRHEMYQFLKQDITNKYILKMSIYGHLHQRQHEEQTDDLFINKQLPLCTLTETIKHCNSFHTDYSGS